MFLFLQVYDLLSRDYKELKDRHKYLEECIKQRDSLIEVSVLMDDVKKQPNFSSIMNSG